MILLDTHAWIWWVERNPRMSARHRELCAANVDSGLAVSVISCWEVAKLVSLGRLTFADSINVWITASLAEPGIQMTSITPEIAIEANRLPGDFHRDPADQLLVATARILDIPLLTVDRKILDYPFVRCLT